MLLSSYYLLSTEGLLKKESYFIGLRLLFSIDLLKRLGDGDFELLYLYAFN